jgi:phosphoglycerate dehydrogenase-like enzyme
MNVLVAIFSPFDAWCIPEAEVSRLRGEFSEHTFVRADTDEEMLAGMADADVAFSSLIEPSHFAVAGRLRWIHSPAAGVGGMLFPAMITSPVVITNSRGNSAVTIAEHAIAVTLALLRRLPLAWQRQSEGRWAQNEFTGAIIRTLRGARVLIVGLGAIGSATGRLASAFGADVVGIRRRPESPRPEGVIDVVAPSELQPQLALADVVVLAAPQTHETRHLMGARQLEAMKAGAVLVNVSRGGLIDEAALIAALQSGRLRGAALDVFEHEPLAAGSPLWARDDVLITPHVSGLHENYWPAAAALFAANLQRFGRGERLLNVVDKAAGY